MAAGALLPAAGLGGFVAPQLTLVEQRPRDPRLLAAVAALSLLLLLASSAAPYLALSAACLGAVAAATRYLGRRAEEDAQA